MADDKGDIDVQDIVAAILGDTQSLTDDELQAIEDLLNYSELGACQRHEFIQTLYNIVAGIIDYRWQTHAMRPTANTRGQKTIAKDESPNRASNMLYSDDKKISQTYKKASAREFSNEDVREGSA